MRRNESSPVWFSQLAPGNHRSHGVCGKATGRQSFIKGRANGMKKAIAVFMSGLSLLLSGNVSSDTLASQHWKTREGMQVIFYPASEVPMMELRLGFRAGSAYDGSDYGLSSLTSSLIGNAAQSMDADAIAEQFESVGAQFSSNINRDMAVYNLRGLTEHGSYTQATRTFTNTIVQARFTDNDFQREQQRSLAAIARQAESADQVATDLFYEKLYGKHPYAHPVDGSRSTVNAITREKVEQFYKRYYVAANAYLVIVGDLSKAQAKALAETISQRLPAGHAAENVPLAKPLKEKQDVNKSFPASQTFLRLGQLGVRYSAPDLFPLRVGNYILGGSPLVSRLGVEVREKRGLTYGVVSQFGFLVGRGPFVIGLSTKTEQVNAAFDLSMSILREFLEKGPDSEELTAAKQYLKGSFPLGLASNRQIADVLLRMAFYDLPANYLRDYRKNIDKVTASEIRKAMQALIQPDKLLRVQVGPQ